VIVLGVLLQNLADEVGLGLGEALNRVGALFGDGGVVVVQDELPVVPDLVWRGRGV
jgi:hypothetical protein